MKYTITLDLENVNNRAFRRMIYSLDYSIEKSRACDTAVLMDVKDLIIAIGREIGLRR